MVIEMYAVKDLVNGTTWTSPNAVAVSEKVRKVLDAQYDAVYGMEYSEDGDRQRAKATADSWMADKLDCIARAYIALEREFRYGDLLGQSMEDIIFEVLTDAERGDLRGTVLNLGACRVELDEVM